MQQIITDTRQLSEAVGYFLTQSEFAFDVETVGEHRLVMAVNQVSWISLATAGSCITIPMGHPNGVHLLERGHRKKNKTSGKFDHFPAVWSAPPKQLRPGQVFEALEPLFFSDRLKIAHNAPFDLLSVAKYLGGRYPVGPYACTQTGAWVVNENRPLGLKPLVKDRYGMDYDKEGTGKCVEKFGFGSVADYAWMDAKADWLLWDKHLRHAIREEGVGDIWALEMEVLSCLLHMGAGVPIDIDSLKALDGSLRKAIVQREADVYRAAGKIFNLNSTPQKVQVLYTEQGLTPKKRTPAGAPSTDAEALEPYQGKNPVVDAILAYQDVSKIHSTYVEGYLGSEDKPTQIFDGRIFPNLKQFGTVSGRFSCSAPNVQNWPRPDTEWGKAIRDLVLPLDMWVLLIADYAQIEQRILAHFAGKGKLWQGFHDGIDAHTQTASVVFGVAPEDVTKAMRQVAKAIAFAINYGAGAPKVADMAGVPVRRARQILKTHEKEFPEVYNYKTRLLHVARSRRPVPYLRTLLGRKRRLPDLLARADDKRARAERQLVNSHIQGSNADITKKALVRLNETRFDEMQILLTVHDEIAVMCHRDRAEEGARLLHDAMAGPDMQLLSVPVTTDVKICNRWSEAK